MRIGHPVSPTSIPQGSHCFLGGGGGWEEAVLPTSMAAGLRAQSWLALPGMDIRHRLWPWRAQGLARSAGQTHLHTACLPPCSRACRGICRTWVCSGRWRRCGSRLFPLSTRLCPLSLWVEEQQVECGWVSSSPWRWQELLPQPFYSSLRQLTITDAT